MSSYHSIRSGTKVVRPLLSIDREEARKKALNLYKAWYRLMPWVCRKYDIPKSVAECRSKLREEFRKHDRVEDVRLIDILIITGHMTLKETINCWLQKSQLMYYYKPTRDPKPTDFLSKFYRGID